MHGYRYNREWMERILPEDFAAYLYGYADKQNAARFSINELALLACMALTPKGMRSYYLHCLEALYDS